MELVTRFSTPDAERVTHRPDVFLPARNTFLRLLENQIFVGADIFDSGNMGQGFDGPLSATMNFDLAFEMALNGAVYSPYLAQEQLLNCFTTSLAGPMPLMLPRQMQNHNRWLSQLPSMFGNKLLDTAVRAVSLVHLGRIQQSEVFVQESRQFYGKALRLLNQSLSNDTNGMGTDTLSATILLSFYEMFASDSNEAWIRHAGGAGTLMRIRGPARHRTGVDRDVYLVYRHTIVIDAFQRDEACFLSEPEWIELAKNIHEDLRNDGMSEERMEIFDLAEDFYLENVFIPATFRDAQKMEEAQRRLPPDQYEAYKESVLARSRLHRANLKSINLKFRAALKKVGLETAIIDTMDPVFPKQYVYINVFVASNHVGYWTIMILLNIVLKEIEKEFAPEKQGLYIMENREIAREICRTAPFMLTSSFLGPFFIIFALRLCLLVFEPGQEKDWVVRKLHEIGATHMKMAADIPNYPADAGVRSKSIEG